MSERIWSVTEAKAHLSEILRLASQQGPQKIGARKAYVVLTEEDWLRLQTPPPHLGEWLIQKFRRAGGLELPDRKAPDRATPFAGFEGS
jgi:Antitoxin Phd_YefM, type II toxin-antitoxin system